MNLVTEYLPWLLSVLTIYMTLLAGNLSKHAWLIGLLNQALWLYWIVATNTWGLIPMNIALWVVYARNHIRWNPRDYVYGQPFLGGPISRVLVPLGNWSGWGDFITEYKRANGGGTFVWANKKKWLKNRVKGAPEFDPSNKLYWAVWRIAGDDPKPVLIPTPIEWWVFQRNEDEVIIAGLVHAPDSASVLGMVQHWGWPDCKFLLTCVEKEKGWRPDHTKYPAKMKDGVYLI